MSSTMIYIIVVLIVTVIGVTIAALNAKKKNKNTAGFLQEHPDASKIKLKNGSGQMKVISVNGEKPFVEIKSSGMKVVVVPGDNVIEVSYQYTKSNLVRNKTTYVDPTKLQIRTEPKKEYEITYDTDQNVFDIAEV